MTEDVRCVVVSGWLIDKSALVRLNSASGLFEWTGRIEQGMVRISTVAHVEIGYTARTTADHRVLLAEPPIS